MSIVLAISICLNVLTLYRYFEVFKAYDLEKRRRKIAEETRDALQSGLDLLQGRR